MRCRLSTIVLLVIFVASSLAAFEEGAIYVAGLLLVMLLGLHRWRMGDKSGKAVFFAALLILAILVGSVCLIVPRETSRSGFCRNNLHQLALALLHYEHMNRSLPPACVRGPDGKPWHSWRVLLLPSADAKPTYEQYDFSEPWDGPKNRQLAEKIPSGYRCPSAPYAPATFRTITSYVAVTGPGTLWLGSESRALHDVRDDPAKTLLLVEIADSDIPWMEPRDLSLEELLRAEGTVDRVRSNHQVDGGYFFRPEDGVLIATADGEVHFLPGRLSKEGLKALATIHDGETLDLKDALVRESIWRRLHWPHVIGLTVFSLSLLALTWQALRRPSKTSPPQHERAGGRETDG